MKAQQTYPYTELLSANFCVCFSKIIETQWRIQDFPEEGAPTPQGGRQHTILPNFPKNCMKLKEFGPQGGGARPKFYYVDPPLELMVTECKSKEYVLYQFSASTIDKMLKFDANQWRIQDFPQGVRQLPKVLLFSIFSWKVHESERIWTLGGARPWRPP